MLTTLLVCSFVIGLCSSCNYQSASTVGCIKSGSGRTGVGWKSSEWPKGVDNVNFDQPKEKKPLKIADAMLGQEADRFPHKHSAMVCEVRAPYVDINAIFVKNENTNDNKGEFGTIPMETDTWRRRWFMRTLKQGGSYKMRVQFYGAFASGWEAQAVANPATIQCGVVYPIRAQSHGCNFVGTINN